MVKHRQKIEAARKPNPHNLSLSDYQSAAITGNALIGREAVQIRLMEERISPPGMVVDNMFFTGGNVLRCFAGRYRFSLEHHRPIVICAGETLIVYPDQRVSIEALDASNHLVYAIFDGSGVSSYFDRIGFFDGAHGKTSAQYEVFQEVKHRIESGEHDRQVLLMCLEDALVTFAHDLRETNGLLFAAARQIKENLRGLIVRLDPLYDQLRVGHSSLHEAFAKAGMGSPSEMIRREQVRLSRHLLVNTDLSVAKIAEEAGFLSINYFANFIKRMTGKTAREIRRNG